jgi:DNA mismatch endonuclease, patch repair protein
MADRFTRIVRSKIMASVRTRNTRPEVRVRSLLHAAGFRFRLHRKNMPGSPDIVLARFNTVVFVHGCFWHSHKCRRGGRPATHTRFWDSKLDRNSERDRQNTRRLRAAGWHVAVIWECDIDGGVRRLVKRLLMSASSNPKQSVSGKFRLPMRQAAACPPAQYLRR